MARPDHLFVFCYDVSRDRDRARLARMLERHCDRVQGSVLEGWMTSAAAERLGQAAARHLGPDDSLRIYCLTESGRENTFVFGTGMVPEADDFVLA